MSHASVTISFEGRPLRCRADATVAAALWEHGVKVLSHSPKYGRPRGLLCAQGHCMGCLMRVDGEPNVRTCRTPVRDGMAVTRQDAGAFYGAPMQKTLDTAGHLFPVGFYYKWFTRPAPLSRTFLDVIRPLTGVGRLPDPPTWSDGAVEEPARDLGRVDVLVIGAGPVGCREALTARGDVLLVDDHAEPGGQRRAPLDRIAERTPEALEGLPGLKALRSGIRNLAERVAAADHVRYLGATRIVGAWQPNLFLLKDAAGLAQVRARRVVWAAGALDALPLFDDNDVPGLFGPRALMRLLTRDGLDVQGERTMVWGSGPDLWLSAALLHASGAGVGVALAPDAPAEGLLLETAQRLGWSLHTGSEPSLAKTRRGALDHLVLEQSGGGKAELPCSLAVLCRRGKPAYDVPYQLGCDLVLDPARGGYAPRAAAEGRAEHVVHGDVRLIVAGEACGRSLEDLIPEVTA